MPATTCVSYSNHFYALEQGMVRTFLLIGTEKALLIDCGVMPDDLRGAVNALTDKPLSVALTHADGDHTRNIEQFADCPIYVNEADQPTLLRDHPALTTLQPLNEGDRFELGGLTLEALHIPGHTYGSVAFLCRAERWLIPGDTASHAAVYLFGATRDFALYRASLERLSALEGFDTLYPSHSEAPLPRDAVEGLLQVCDGIADGSIVPDAPENEHQRMGGAKLYRRGACAILFAPKG